MFLLNLKYNKNKELLNKLYKDLVEYKLYNLTEIILKPDYEKGDVDYSGLICSYVLLRLRDLKEMDWMDIEDIFFNIIESKMEVIFDSEGIDEDKLKEIIEIADDTGINYLMSMKYDFEKPLNLRKLDNETHSTILEIFEMQQIYPLYSAKNFLHRFDIDNEGNVFDVTGKLFGNLIESSLVDIIFKRPSDYKKLKQYSELNEKELVFSQGFSNVLPFLSIDKDINLKIDNFKLRIFDAIKNLKPEDYINLDFRLVEILNSQEYVKYDDLIKIIKNEDDVYKVKNPLDKKS